LACRKVGRPQTCCQAENKKQSLTPRSLSSWDTNNLSGPNAEDDKPWYNDDWTDWIHPLALVAYCGATQGERIGNGIGVFSVGQLKTSMDIAELRKSRALERLGDADSPISVQEAQDEQRRASFGGVNEVIHELGKVADGQLATAELAGTAINVGQVGRGALQMAGAAAQVAPGAKTVEDFLLEAQRRLDATKAKSPGMEGVMGMAKKLDIKRIDRIVNEEGLTIGQLGLQ